MMLGILNYGLGNIKSISNMLDYLDIDHIFVKNKNDFLKINKLILPGIGSFDTAMKYLNERDFINEIKHFVSNSNNYLIGICLGMQILGNKSEEGFNEGLKLIDFNVLSLKNHTINNVPHMGWSEVSKNNFEYKKDSIDKFYFVHSYFVPLTIENSKYETIMICDYGIKYSAAIKRNNIFGFQFHPEKSHKFGMDLFKFLAKL